MLTVKGEKPNYKIQSSIDMVERNSELKDRNYNKH